MFRYTDREPIHNIWDHDSYFKKLKDEFGQSPSAECVVELERFGRSLLTSSDPYQLKLGMHLLRLCIWHDKQLAREWVNNMAPDFLSHSHARVRQSALWNVRCAIWQNSSLTSRALEYARRGLNDTDPGIQRMSLWVHGDCVVNNPQLLEAALASVQGFLKGYPKETNYLFALERFYNPIKSIMDREEIWREIVREMMRNNYGMLGLKARCSLALREPCILPEQEIQFATQKVLQIVQGTPLETLVASAQFKELLQVLIQQFHGTQIFADRMKTLWLIRSILWSSRCGDEALYRVLSENVSNAQDGDLLRTIIVVLGDCILQNPVELSVKGIQSTIDFFRNSDIDGSQIVVAQTFLPLAKFSDKAGSLLSQVLSDLNGFAANISVTRALQQIMASEQ